MIGVVLKTQTLVNWVAKRRELCFSFFLFVFFFFPFCEQSLTKCMDGREAMALSGGSASYYIHRGGGLGGSGSGSQPPTGLHTPSGFRPLSNTGIPSQANVRGSSVGSSFSVEPPHPSRAGAGFPHGGGARMAVSPPGVPSSEQPVKKKRGRPRKYGPDGPVSLRLSSMSASQNLTPGSATPTPKRARGRPPGTGRKQQLAALGKIFMFNQFTFNDPISC